MSSKASSMPGETASSEVQTQFVNQSPEQSSFLSTFAQYTAHSDHSHAPTSPTTNNHEQSSAPPCISYEYSFDPAMSQGSDVISAEPQSLSRTSSDPFLNLFTHPGASVEVALPADFNFDLPELGEFDAFEQWFGPGGLDIAGYPTFSDPTSLQQRPHQLPYRADPGHELIKQETSTHPSQHQSPARPGAFAHPKSPPRSPPTTLLPHPVPYSFPTVGAPSKSEHSGLCLSTPPPTCHYVGHQEGWKLYQPVTPA